MITAINFPPANTILLDGNKTPITVTSTNGVGFYFRAEIYIDDVLFDEQGWSRKDNFTATKDLMYLYHAYFNPSFLGSFSTGLLEQFNFKKKVTIVINEYDINTDILVGTLTLPDFFIIFNIKSEQFNSNNKLIIFGLKAERYRMKKNGTIVIPFYANANSENVSVIVKDNFNNILHQEVLLNLTGQKVFVFTLNLDDVTLISTADYLTAEINVGNETITKIYTLIKLPNYEVKEIVYQNNFGYYIPAYFDGDFEDVSGFTVQSYEQYDTSLAVYAIEEDVTYTINTGNFNFLEKETINEVANSIDCYFKNGNIYTNVISAIKKSTNQKSRLNIFAEDLQFKVKKGLPFNNENLTGSLSGNNVTLDLNLISVTLSHVDNSGSNPKTYFDIIFTSGFPLFQIFIQVRPNSSWNWGYNSPLANVISPQQYFIVGNENHDVRLYAYYQGQIIYSNILTFTL